MSNCTSKMLLGYPCLGPPRPGLDANRAIAVVRAAGFVGLTERFADSLLLLKRTFDFDAVFVSLLDCCACARSSVLTRILTRMFETILAPGVDAGGGL